MVDLSWFLNENHWVFIQWLKQSNFKIVLNFQIQPACPDYPVFGIRHPASGIRHPASSIQHPVSSIQLLFRSYLLTKDLCKFSNEFIFATK